MPRVRNPVVPAIVSVSAFSHSTCLPAPIASSAIGKCEPWACTPRDNQLEPLLERGGPRGVVAAQRPAGEPDTVGVDVGSRLQVVHARLCPVLGLDPSLEPEEAQRLTAAGAVDH